MLRAFEEAKKDIEYFALDLSLPELHRTLSAIPAGKYQFVKCAGLHGTYEDGLAWLKRTRSSANATCVLSLGSSIGNFSRIEAAKFLRQFSRVLRPQDSFLIGLDSCEDAHRIFQAYNDSKGVTEAFYRNALTHANRLLGYDGFKQSQWDVVGRYDQKLQCHDAHYAALFDVDINGIQITKGSKIHFEQAYKYSSEQMSEMWKASGFTHHAAFGNEKRDYSKLYLGKHSNCPFPPYWCVPKQQSKSPKAVDGERTHMATYLPFSFVHSGFSDTKARIFLDTASPPRVSY